LPLSRLVYICVAARAMTPRDLHELQSGISQANSIRDVTGVLIYIAGNFAQCIEGRAGVISDLFDVIKRDRRHRQVQRLSYQATPSRLFEEWSMGLLNVDELKRLDRDRMVKHMARLRNLGLSPNTPKYCVEILKEFRAQLPKHALRRGA